MENLSKREQRQKEFQKIQEWREQASRLASFSLSGAALAPTGQYTPIVQKARGIAFRAWERLCARELRSASDVRKAAKQIGNCFERDMREAEPDEHGRDHLNDYWKAHGSIVTELEWFSEVYVVESINSQDPRPLTEQFEHTAADLGLPGWRSWEIDYVIALRMVDDAIRARSRNDLELAAYLLIEAMDAINGGDFIADRRHRNTEHYVTQGEIAYNEARKRIEKTERQREIASRSRPDALTGPISEFVRDGAVRGWKGLQSFLENHSSFRCCCSVDNRLEWETQTGERGSVPIGSLPSRLTRARKAQQRASAGG